MVAIIAAAVLALTGIGFLLSASFMALSEIYSPAVAAAIVGGSLVLVAGIVWLVSTMAKRHRSDGALAPIARAAVGVQSSDDTVNQIVGALKQDSPLTVLAAAAGLLFGLFMRGRRHI